jgi:hypothetical protein
MSKFPGLDRDAVNEIARAVVDARKRDLKLLDASDPRAPREIGRWELKDGKFVQTKLDDTTPPVEPPAVPPVASDITPHRVSAWRHTGSMANSVHDSLEHARLFAATLSAEFFWKYAIVRLGGWPTVIETKPIGGVS